MVATASPPLPPFGKKPAVLGAPWAPNESTVMLLTPEGTWKDCVPIVEKVQVTVVVPVHEGAAPAGGGPTDSRPTDATPVPRAAAAPRTSIRRTPKRLKLDIVPPNADPPRVTVLHPLITVSACQSVHSAE
jgi:hypothetical protein